MVYLCHHVTERTKVRTSPDGSLLHMELPVQLELEGVAYMRTIWQPAAEIIRSEPAHGHACGGMPSWQQVLISRHFVSFNRFTNLSFFFLLTVSLCSSKSGANLSIVHRLMWRCCGNLTSYYPLRAFPDYGFNTVSTNSPNLDAAASAPSSTLVTRVHKQLLYSIDHSHSSRSMARSTSKWSSWLHESRQESCRRSS